MDQAQRNFSWASLAAAKMTGKILVDDRNEMQLQAAFA